LVRGSIDIDDLYFYNLASTTGTVEEPPKGKPAAPNVPHVHLETFKLGANKPSVNNHIPFVD